MKKFKLIMVAGFTDKNTATLWDGKEIITATSFNVEDFDFGEDAEQELKNCQDFIISNEENNGWLQGYVTCWIDIFDEIEEEID